MLVLGQIGLALALIASVLSVVAFLWGRSMGKHGAGMTRGGYYLTFGAVAGLSLAILLLIVGFFTKDYSIQYVATNHSTDTSSLAWLYQLSGLWAGREGSLLLWAWFMSVFGGLIAWKGIGSDEELNGMALMVLNIILSLFTVAMIFSHSNNPFIATPAEYLSNGQLVGMASSWGMNPLLQHWAMILHPPTLFLGYAGLTVPFAYAMATLICNDPSDKWIKLCDRMTIFSWLFLGAGIGLGAIWAYVVLGWGGYWAWDPVENASILPWFVGVAMIHSFTMYRRRNGFKRWAIMTSAISFAMVVLGTFITRSGIVQSVHAFEKDNLSLWLFLAIIFGSVIVAIIGLAIRWKEFSGDDEFESLTGREAAYYFNNVLMTVASLSLAYMTVASALPKWLPFGGQSLGASAYEFLARPVGLLYLAILAVCPVLSWAKTSGAEFWKRIKWPLVASLILFAALMTEWAINLRPVYADMVAKGGESAKTFLNWGPSGIYHGIAILGFLLGSFVICNTAALFVRGVMARREATGESIGSALYAVFFKARTQSGGYLSHIAIGIMIIGLIGSAMYVRDLSTNIIDKTGSTIVMKDYKLTYQGLSENTKDNGDVEAIATFDVSRNGKPVGVVKPSMTTFATQGQSRLNAVVLSEPLRDIFVVFQGKTGDQISMDVKINPLIWFVWIGFALLLAATALASWPKKKALSA